MPQDFNDSLSDLFTPDSKPVERKPEVPTQGGQVPTWFKPVAERAFVEPCSKCRGSGNWRPGYPCFACKGTGRKVFKTSQEERAKGRVNAARSAERREATRAQDAEKAIETFKADHSAEYAWLIANVERFEFATSLWNALRQYGTLTEGQLRAVGNCIAKQAARNTERAARINNAPTISIERIEQAFESAKSRGLSKLILRLDSFQFKPAKASSSNVGAIYVTENSEYLGKVMGGKFHAMRTCGAEREARIIAVAANPESAAVAYGKLTSQCSCCGRTLSDPDSIARGIGPICAETYGW